MSLKKEKKDFAERRRYRRLDHIFPVEFQFLDPQNQPVSGWRQAFSQDISEGGLCLTINHLSAQDLMLFEDKNTVVALAINIPLGSESVKATARPAWIKNLKKEPAAQYAVGVCYETIQERDKQRILRYAGTRRFLKALAIVFTLFLSGGLVLAGFYNARLRYENENLLAGLSRNLSHQRALEEGGTLLKSHIEEMKFSLSQADRKIAALQQKLLLVSSQDEKAIAGLKRSIDFFKKQQEKVSQDLAGLTAQSEKVDRDADAKAQEASLLEKKILDKLYRWLVVHQNNRTGLVASFEGDRDIADWGFTYDQALAAMVFTGSGDAAHARKILDFYLKAEKTEGGGFANAYYASTGDVAEYVAHTGPNIWLGLAMLQYSHKTKDMRYLNAAKNIAQWLETVKDEEGGLKGGMGLSWYSTEHNLDAYAFYALLNRLTGQETYKERAQETLQWLNKNAYSKVSGPMVKRGKGDATIATDTFAWSITAIGPRKIKEIGMDPDGIMDYAIADCGVSAEYKKPQGPLVQVKGFDFAKHQNLARGGVVSCEWTAQMILAFKIMADYHRSEGNEEKAKEYARLAQDYTAEMSKMVITSPSPVGQGEFCLPYASHEFADTGHGWRTPKGDRTGSVAATAYTILALKDFNPLDFNE